MENIKNIKNISLKSPHIRVKKDTQSVMLHVIIAMLPALAAAMYFFGIRALLLTLVSVISCVISEFVIQKILKKPVRIKDLSAVVTGILLAFNVPVSLPFWIIAIGGIFAIVVVKEFFGGIGQNFMNPALAGRIFLVLNWPAHMGNWTYDGLASATPLAGRPTSFLDLFIGNIPGSLGEVSKLAILIGLLYLLYKEIINLRMPLTYFIGSMVFLYIFQYDVIDTIYQLMSGGIILAAVFMITDYSSSPMSQKGQYIYAIGAAFLTAIIRIYGAYPEGVAFSILIMNVFTPLIDRLVRPRVFGVKGANQ